MDLHDSHNIHKCVAESIGTFWLTFAGCGSAVIAAGFPAGRHRPARRLARLRPDACSPWRTRSATSRAAISTRPSPSASRPAGASRRKDIAPYIVAQVVGAVDRRRGPLRHRQRRARLRPRQGLRRQRLRRALAGQLQPALRPAGRGRADHDVPVHHHGRDPWQGAGRASRPSPSASG